MFYTEKSRGAGRQLAIGPRTRLRRAENAPRHEIRRPCRGLRSLLRRTPVRQTDKIEIDLRSTREHALDGQARAIHQRGVELDLELHGFQRIDDALERDLLHVRTRRQRRQRDQLLAGILLAHPVQDAAFRADDERARVRLAHVLEHAARAQRVVRHVHHRRRAFGMHQHHGARVRLANPLRGLRHDPVVRRAEARPQLELAVVRPLTSEYFGNSAQWENGKWVYTALTHAHLPLDPLDEEFLLSEDLGRYKVIYISGSHIRRDVVPAIIKYVENGGTLFTDCGGMRRDESGQTIEELMPVFGLESRGDPELWGSVPRYGATSLGAIKAEGATPPDAVVNAADNSSDYALKVGWERLKPVPGATVVATFLDGSPALVCNEYGKGKAWLAGWYSGVEYATGVMKEGYDCSVDFPSAQRDLIAFAAVSAGARPAVDPSHPLVEGVRVRNPKTGREAVVLMNWAYRGRDLVVINDLKVVIPNAGSLRGARSVAQRRNLEAVRDGATLVVDVGEMQEGDVLLLE